MVNQCHHNHPNSSGQGTCYNTLDSSENVLKRSGVAEGLADNESGAFLLLLFTPRKAVIAGSLRKHEDSGCS